MCSIDLMMDLHIFYGDGQEMHKRMKPNNLLIILRAHHPVTDKIRWRKFSS